MRLLFPRFSLLLLLAIPPLSSTHAQTATCEQPQYNTIQINGGKAEPAYQCSGEEATLIIRLSGGLPELDGGQSAYQAAISINGKTQRQTVASNGAISNTLVNLEDGDFWQVQVWDEAHCDTAQLGFPEPFKFKKVKAQIERQSLGTPCLGELLTLDGQQSSGEQLRYTWSPIERLESRADRPMVKTRAIPQGKVSLRVQDAWGCTDEAYYSSQPHIASPTGFTPNGDGINDTWWLPCLDEQQVALSIKDASGKIIFQNKAYQNNWDGSTPDGQLPSGTYFYTLTLYLENKRYLDYEGSLKIMR